MLTSRRASFSPILLLLLVVSCSDAWAQQETYCNPMNLDYAYCPIPDFVTNGKHRATADPVIVQFRDSYYLFSTNQWGYWWSDDLLNWNFVARKFLKPEHKVYDELCAPAAFVMDDALYVIGSTYTTDFTLWRSRNPKTDDWEPALDNFPIGAWDPAFFVEDDRLYLYHGSSNTFPLYAQELNSKTFEPKGRFKELFTLNPEVNGWERFGEAHDNVFLKPFLEGAWMTKHAGKYYFQYSAPGTEFSGYADGVYVGDTAMGPFYYQPHNPFSLKQGGFVRGAGHGSTFQDRIGNWWHVATTTICVKNNFERRLGLWPAGFDPDGVLSCNTAYGDYPTRITPLTKPEGNDDGMSLATDSHFAGWMLLNYNKPVIVSSTLGSAFPPNYAVDEDIKTYWCAATDGDSEFLQTDLGKTSTVHAIQINYADQDATVMGKVAGLYHAYQILSSTDGKDWKVAVDKSKNRSDVPHDYVEFEQPIEARYLQLRNIHVPSGKFAISGFRVFGRAPGAVPNTVKNLVALRGESERRAVWLKWQPMQEATGFVIRWGVEPTKLYSSMMFYGQNECVIRTLNRDQEYYFQIEAFNESGIGPRSSIVECR